MKHSSTSKAALLVICFASLWAAGQCMAATPAALITIVEGRAKLLRGASVFRLQQGVAVVPGDIFETDERTHVQVEFADGTTVGIGSNSTALLGESPSGVGKPGSFYLASGWLKAAGGSTAGQVRTSTSSFSLSPKSGVYVLHREGAQAEFFVESGQLVPTALRKGASSWDTRNAGDFVMFKPSATEPEVLKRPSPQFLAALPRTFTNTFPARFVQILAKKVEPVWESDISFADADRWLRTYPYDRKQWLTRVAGRLKDKDFRAQAEKSLPTSPEWDPVFHPEKSLAKASKP